MPQFYALEVLDELEIFLNLSWVTVAAIKFKPDVSGKNTDWMGLKFDCIIPQGVPGPIDVQ